MSNILFDIADQLSRRTEFSALAMERARDAVIDTLGCMIAGSRDASVRTVTAAFGTELSSGGHHWLVTGAKAPSSLAALVNGTAAHALDFDDNFHPARAHASAVLVPALLAVVGPDRVISGKRFLEAYLTGLEAQAAIGFGVNPSHYNTGWHGTSTVGAIGAAAGVAHLLGTKPEEMAHAMSLAASMACGLKGQFGSQAKPVHAGLAARNAVEATRLADAGVTGRLDILERPQGFLNLFGGEEPRGWSDWTLEEAHIIETRGLVTKIHPCCASTHRAVDALLDLKRQHKLQLADIVAIDTKVGISAFRNLAYPDPTDEMQARFSMQYCLAAAFVRGKLSLSDFEPGALNDVDIRALMLKVTMQSFTADEERGHERLAHAVTVTLTNGETLQKSRMHARGALEDTLTCGERRQKFEDNIDWGWSQNNRRFYNQLMAINDAECMWSLLPSQ